MIKVDTDFRRSRMIGTLNESQIEALLDRVIYGHLGCHLDDRIYVVPMSFVDRSEHDRQSRSF